MNTRNVFEMLLCSEKKANKKVSGFKVCSRVLNFIVIGHYTINSPDINFFRSSRFSEIDSNY